MLLNFGDFLHYHASRRRFFRVNLCTIGGADDRIKY